MENNHSLAPIVLFVYNRPWHTLQTLEALSKNELADSSNLFIYCDGPKANASLEDLEKVSQVRNVIKEKNWCKTVTIIENTTNKGLANSIIDGVTEIVNKYNKIIVLEDDLTPTPWFLKFMNEALDKYESANDVACISGYIYPVSESLPETFFIKGADCWGWATWKRAWNIFEPNGKKLLDQLDSKKLTSQFDFNNCYPYTKMLSDQINKKNNSWAIRWYASAFLENKLVLYPGKSLIENIGFDGSGTHSDVRMLENNSSTKSVNIKDILIEEDKIAKGYIGEYLKSLNHLNPNSPLRVFKRIIKKIKSLTLTLDTPNDITFKKAEDWETAKGKSIGYKDPKIFEKAKYAALQVKSGKAVFERDSFLFHELKYSVSVLNAFKLIYSTNNYQLNIVDFGGSLGSCYFQYKTFFKDGNIDWKVVEQPHIVEFGTAEIANSHLHFFNTIGDAYTKGTNQTLFISSVLQYIPDYKKLISEINTYNFQFIIIDRTSFITGNEQIMIQEVPKRIYHSTYPIHFFSLQNFIALFENKYDILYTFDSYCDPSIKTADKQLLFWKGFILKLKHDA